MRGVVSTFPRTYAGRSTAELVAVYAAGPDRLRAAVAGLQLEDLRRRPRPGKWSILETALHVVDSELMGAGRIRLACAQPGAVFIAYDQDRWTAKLGYQNCDDGALGAALTLFAALRQHTNRLFDRASAEHWHRSGWHPEHGDLTLRNLLELYADHGERHIGQILEGRRLLSREVSLPRILDERLY